MVKEDFERFLQGRQSDLNTVALQPATSPARWSEIKSSIGARLGRTVSDSTVNNILDNLTEAMLVEHVEGGFRVADPMLRTLLLNRDQM